MAAKQLALKYRHKKKNFLVNLFSNMFYLRARGKFKRFVARKGPTFTIRLTKQIHQSVLFSYSGIASTEERKAKKMLLKFFRAKLASMQMVREFKQREKAIMKMVESKNNQ